MNIGSLLERHDRVKLGFLPTPLEYVERLTKALGGPKIFFKRDDCTGLAFGGNKVRKLEFVMADALKRKADVVITIGGLQSNWARQTAAAAKKLGMEVIQVLDGEEPATYQGNLLLDRVFGCDIRFRHISREEEDKEIFGETPVTGPIIEEVKERKKIPYVAALGAANPLGCLGYIAWVDEVSTQLEEMGLKADYMALAVGTGGTQAGIEIGLRLLNLDTAVLGFSISRHTREKAEEMAELCNQTTDFLGLPHIRFAPDEYSVTYDYIGEGYAVPTDDCIKAIRLVAQTEGIILDPVYTGKAMAGLIHMIEAGKFRESDNVIFLHSGGNTANFAYGDWF
jgi:D-cysteine desulfhydrase family pyridoxal phosphate-dependent enzyme